jgi:cyclopropane fatty-acyl-phospholipid synthase-like methyltransferase
MAENPVYSTDDILRMLDALLRYRGNQWWDDFYSDRAKPCPFFVRWPDESLVSYFDSESMKPGRVLELGCGNGRNAICMAGRGCEVDAVDFSEEAVRWGWELATEANVDVHFMCQSMFDLAIPPQHYDIIYDAGCFHHLPPHRRESYVELVRKAMRPGGRFGLVCFTPEGGAGLSDLEVYEQRKLGGGLGYTEEQLRYIFSHSFEILECRGMVKTGPDSELFGEDYLWALLMRPR